ncbi:MAG TPA: alpha-2-macroglobulin family protein, partial [Gemmata sp.]
GETKNARYKAALEAFTKANPEHELFAMAQYQLADVLQTEGDLIQARELALVGQKAFPESPGGKLCYNLVQQIESKSASATTERVWADPLPTIKVNYKNIMKAYFRVVPANFTDRLKATRWRPEYLSEREAKALLDQKPVLEFSHDLPATDDFKARTEIVPAPGGLKPGFYFLVVSHRENFGATNNVVNYTDFWVSDLALVSRHDYNTPQVAGMVTENRTGAPIEGAKVRVWTRNNNGGWNAGETGTTDKNGLYAVPAAHQQAHLVVVTHKEQQLSSANEWHTYHYDRAEQRHEQTVFFTDRALYRPGQTIQFKGITIRFDHGNDNYEVVPNRDVEVLFTDVNGKEISRHKTRSNDYGSFSGSFPAPRDRLMGRMSIRTTTGNGGTAVNVEEYKRPKFKVEVEAPKGASKLNDTVKVPGKATQYNGVPVGGAKVTFRVTREVRYPDWFFEFCWWRPIPSRPAQEIAHGIVVTEPDGSFVIPFVAKPDLSVPVKDEPSFRYTVSADVTDTTGETRSASKSVNVGYVALRATVGSDAWVTSDKETTFTVTTTTLDGEGQAAKGAFKIHALKQPNKVARPDLEGGYHPRFRAGANEDPLPDASKPASWELGDVVFSANVETNGNGKAEVKTKLAPGVYRTVLETADAFEKKVTARYQFTVVNPTADTFPVKVPNFVNSPKWSVEVGEEFTLLWGSGYDTARAFVEVEHRGKVLRSFWTEKNATQHVLKVPVKEDMRGGFTVRVTQVNENRAYLTSRHVDVPWTNKNLTVKWERFVNKLEPGAKETFTAVITGPDAKKAVAEVVAALYDESLDAYLPHDWMHRFSVFRMDHSNLHFGFNNQSKGFQHIHGQWRVSQKPVDLTYRGFPGELTMNWMRYEYFGKGGGYGFGNRWGQEGFDRGLSGGFGAPQAAMPAAPPAPDAAGLGAEPKKDGGFPANGLGQEGPSPGPDLNNVSARKNLNETAFFFPHLTSDEDGTVRMTFTMPEALTKWKFLGFAHDKNLRSGFITDTVTTAKDLMAQPNPPRFLREGDQIEFTVKVSNQSATRQKGTARVSFKDIRTEKPVDQELGLVNVGQAFDLAAGESKTLSWKISVPDGLGPISYKAVAATDRLSDGEEAVIPVLSRRVLVQESMPLPIRGPQAKDFDFAKLRNSGASQTIRNQSYTVQMVSQPAWYAVMALPYLMEYPYECSEQTFNRLYANALARHIANSDPKIRKVFDQWKNTPALDSPLEKNQDLKTVVLEETPWVRQAQAESVARKNVGVLFDANRLDSETERQLRKLAEMQHADGSWPWFPGGPGNDYITLYITTGFGRMRHLGVKIDTASAVRAINRLDGWAQEQYALAQKHKPEENHLSSLVALYLYGRSFFLADKGIENQHRAALDYWLGQAKKYWLQLANRQSQAHLALALKRFGDKDAPQGIMKSIKERSKNEEELGMYWRDTELSYSWVRAPIETQAMMVEAFDEVMNDEKAVEDCKVWLLKQKQTQDWKTTKATADAVYALLLRGDNLLKSDALVEVTVGNQVIKPEKVEAGTGFYEQKFVRNEVQPSMGTIHVKKTDKGVSWGSVHWSYLEDISKVTPHDGTPLKLEKKLFKKTLTKSGPVISPIKEGEALGVGDEVVVRIVLRTDRDMEYVHMRDHRGSGTEPVNVLSRYKYQDGLGYYESTKDAATHFFIDYLPKGVYVFEYPVRVQLKGKYPTGFANIECMYAPEFNSHSESINLEVK